MARAEATVLGMPELPEVETIRRQLEPVIVGRTITEAWAFPSGKFTPAVEAVGATIEAVGRRGKFLLIGLDDDRDVARRGESPSVRLPIRPGELRAGHGGTSTDRGA